VALHTDAQTPTLAPGKLGEAFFRLFQLRQKAPGEFKQILPRLGRSQTAPLATPEIDSESLFELTYSVAQGRLREMELLRCGSQRTSLCDGTHDFEMNAFQCRHDDLLSCKDEIIPFLFISQQA
jgi:CDGSH-type Zn-finger protein